MTLSWLIVTPLVGAILAGWFGRASATAARLVALAACAVGLVLTVLLGQTSLFGAGEGSWPWMLNEVHPWIPAFGMTLRFGMDGIAEILIILGFAVGAMAILASWHEIAERVGLFHFNLLLTIAGVVGVFLALDLFLFFLFWELMLVPMYFLIAGFGHGERLRSAIKFVIFTQAGGLLLLIGIFGLAFAAADGGPLSFAYGDLLGTRFSGPLGFWLMLAFFLAFAVKLPAVPLHPWLPDAHTDAPTGASILLAAVMLKTGAYGLLRFAIPLFPAQSMQFAPVAMAMGVAGVIYAALLAFGQRDFKRLIAYSSIAHLGFVLIGLYAWTTVAVEGAYMQMIAHGISTGALFTLAGIVQDRLGTRDMHAFGGLWKAAPSFGAGVMFFAVASLGLPGIANFIGEFMILIGTYTVAPWAAILGALGVVGAVVYSLALVFRSVHGPLESPRPFPDLTVREGFILLPAALVAIWLGVYPQPVFSAISEGVEALNTTQIRVPTPEARP